jgi:hypothetical protein
MDQDVRIDPEKMHNAIVNYGLGSILNVNLQALPEARWREIIQAIQHQFGIRGCRHSERLGKQGGAVDEQTEASPRPGRSFDLLENRP